MNPEIPIQWERWPFREIIHFELGRYVIDEPLVIDPGQIESQGQTLYARGFGPEIEARGVVLTPSDNFKGDAVVKVLGCRPNIMGLHVDVPKPIEGLRFGVYCAPKFVNGKPHITGGSCYWQGLTIEGFFDDAALCLDSFEECTFLAPNLHAHAGNGLVMANGGVLAPPHSMTRAKVIGGSIYAYNSFGIATYGDLNDNSIDAFVASPFGGLKSFGGGERNILDNLRLETRPSGVLLSGSGWTKRSTSRNINPAIQ